MAHVKFRRDGREQLATVTGVEYNWTRGCYLLNLRYFNGENAGQISAAAVQLLERD